MVINKIKRFKNAKTYQRYIRKHNEVLDVVKVEGKIFTMDMYDLEGKYIYYGNLKHALAMEIKTEDRYSSKGFKDAVVTIKATASFRPGLDYIE